MALKQVVGDRREPIDSLLFISYARSDQSFVRVFDERLRNQNRKTWVDWKDIPFTGEWENEIYSAIERADAFIFVISSRAAASVQCRKEIQHAVKHNKRLVPIVREDVPHDKLDPSIAEVNWLFFRDTDDFETAFKLLLAALDTNLDWLHSHTLLLIRAIEWEHNNRDGSHTIRGTDLRTAEAWIEQAEEHPDLNPRPTKLQVEYVTASRRQERYRKRIALAAVSVALVITSILAAGLIRRSRQARENAKLADTQGQIALSRQLVARSIDLRKQPANSLSTAALLALEAIYRFPSRESESALRRSLNLTPVALATFPKRRVLTSVTFTSGGECIEIADGIAHIWDPKTGSEVTSTPIPGANSVASSTDGKFLAIAKSDSIEVRASKGFQLVAELPGHTDLTALSAKGKYLAIGDERGATVFDLRTKQPTVTIPYNPRLRSLAFSPDARYLALAGDDNFAHVWDIEARQEISRIKQEENVWSVAFTPDGKNLTTATANDTTRVYKSPEAIKFWDAATGKLLKVIRDQHDVMTVSFNSTGDLIATTDLYGSARILETSSGRELLRIDMKDDAATDATIKAVAFDPGSQYIATANNESVQLWKIAYRTILLEAPSEISSVAVNAEGSLIAAATRDNIIRVWDAQTAHLISKMVQREPGVGVSAQVTISPIEFSPDGRYLASGNSDTTARLWETETGKEIARWPIPGGVDKLVFDSQSAMLAIVGNGRVTLIDCGSRHPVGTLQQSGLMIQDAAFCPNGNIATSGTEFRASAKHVNSVTLWDVKDLRSNKTAFQQTGPVWPRLSVTGSHAVTWTDQTVEIWDVAAGRIASTFPDTNINEIKFSPDEQSVIISKNDGQIIRELSKGEEKAFIAEESGNEIIETAFAHDGKHLIIGLEDRSLRLLPTFRKTVIEEACQHFSQNLTHAEWGQYLSTEPYRKTCPNLP